MRNRIWNELTTAKFNSEFTMLYEVRQRKFLRFFNIIILIFSSGGVLGWPFWESLPGIVCIIVCLVSLFKLIQPQIIMSDIQILNLSNIGMFYNNYYNQIERIWFDYEDGTINSDQAKRKLYKLKREEESIIPKISDVIKNQPKGVVKKATTYTDNYFRINFKTNKS